MGGSKASGCWVPLALFVVGCSGGQESPADISGPEQMFIEDALTTDPVDDVVEVETRVEPSPPAQGVLQLRVTHNMAEPGCLGLGNCQLEFEAPAAETLNWVEALSQHGTMPVLHWDRPMPWIAFSEDPTGDMVDFYNGRMPAELLAYVDAYAAAFSVGGGYLALTPLSGARDAVKPQFIANGEVHVGQICDSMASDEVFSVDLGDGTGPQEFNLGVSYLNFVRYMVQRLQPAYLALGIEVNLYEEKCAGHEGAFDDFASLYRSTYDQLRQDGVSIPIFGTFTLVELLGYHEDHCQGPLDFTSCDSARPELPSPTPETCFPVHRTSVDVFDEGGRLDILALSYYPDRLNTNVEGDVIMMQSADSGQDGECLAVSHLYDVPDPLEHLGLLGWDKAMAFAEIGAHSCTVPIYFPALNPGDNPFLLVLPGSISRQAHHLSKIMDAAAAHKMPFVVNAFLNDFLPVLPAVAQEEVLPPSIVALVNAFSCMGLRDVGGTPKTELPWTFP